MDVNREALKKESAEAIASALLREAPQVREWISSQDLNPESVERGRQIQALIEAARKPYIGALDECLEAMTPFAFMATAFDRNATMVEVCKRGVQALTAGALWRARDVWLRFADRRLDDAPED
jgi:hypothetical protein